MITKMFHNWWLYAVRGVLGILFGVLALIWPGKAVTVLVVLFGAFALVDGVFAMVAGFIASAFHDRWWAIALEGLAGIVIGVLTLVWPHITAQVLLYFIASWAIIIGILTIVAAVHLRRVVREWVLIFNGLLSIILGILLFIFPNSGLLALVWAIAIFAIIHGIFLIVDAFRLRTLWNEFKTADQMIKDTYAVLSWWMRY